MSPCARLPNLAYLRLDHRLSGFTAEGRSELLQVSDDAVDARETGGMWVGGCLQTAVRFARVFACPLCKANEESLIGGEAFCGLKIHPGCGFFPCHIGNQRSAEIGDVFTAGELGVDVDVIHDDVSRELVAEAVDTIFKALGVLFGPPVLQVPLCIELAALIVEAMGQLM